MMIPLHTAIIVVRDGQLGMGHVGGRRRRQLLTSMRFDSSLVTNQIRMCLDNINELKIK